MTIQFDFYPLFNDILPVVQAFFTIAIVQVYQSKHMANIKGGSGKNQGRKLDWGEKPESRISVPYELSDYEQKKALAKTWSILKQAGKDFTALASCLESNGISLMLQDEAAKPSKEPQLYRIYSAAVAASFGVVSPSDADAGGYEEIELSSLLIKVPERTILLEVTGNSMVDEGIFPGSILIVETTNTTNKSWLQAETGDIVVARIENAASTDLTVKRFERNAEGEFLVPRNRRNKNYQPIRVGGSDSQGEEEQKTSIIGIVKKIIQDV